jgi:hypothetical protein
MPTMVVGSIEEGLVNSATHVRLSQRMIIQEMYQAVRLLLDPKLISEIRVFLDVVGAGIAGRANHQWIGRVRNGTNAIVLQLPGKVIIPRLESIVGIVFIDLVRIKKIRHSCQRLWAQPTILEKKQKALLNKRLTLKTRVIKGQRLPVPMPTFPTFQRMQTIETFCKQCETFQRGFTKAILLLKV